MDVSIESLLALIGELYVKNRVLEDRLEKAEPPKPEKK